MIAFIIWIVGLILTIKACGDLEVTRGHSQEVVGNRCVAHYKLDWSYRLLSLCKGQVGRLVEIIILSSTLTEA